MGGGYGLWVKELPSQASETGAEGCYVAACTHKSSVPLEVLEELRGQYMLYIMYKLHVHIHHHVIQMVMSIIAQQ